MKKDTIEWLGEELKKWLADGLISEQQAGAIRARYPVSEDRLPWGMIIFSSIGAIIGGLGVILLFAYNWHAIPKLAKIALIFGVLAATHAAGIGLFLKSARFRALGEGLCLLGSMLFGAGIWLIAQIYHIEEHFPNGFLIWGIGALLMALALPSIPQGILAAILLTVWGGVESLEFHTAVISAPLLILFLLGSFTYYKKSGVLLACVIPAFVLSMVFAILHHHESEWEIFTLLLNIAALFIAMSFLARRYGVFPESAPILGFYGWSMYFVILYLMSFPGLCHEFFSWHHVSASGSLAVKLLAPLPFCLAGWAFVIYRRLILKDPRQAGEMGLDFYLIPLTVLLAYTDLFFLAGYHEGWVIAGPFNLVYLGLTAAMMARGCREGILRQTIIGSILLVAIMLSRYFDLFESLFIRGLVFVAVGALVFLEGIFYSKARKRQVGGKAP